MLYRTENKLDLKLLIALSRATQMVHRRSSIIFKEGGLTINQIISTVLSTSGNMTVVINNLEKEKLVNRYVNPTDKRSCLITITEKGRSKIEEIFPIHLQDRRDCFSIYSEEEKQQLVKLLKKLKMKGM